MEYESTTETSFTPVDFNGLPVPIAALACKAQRLKPNITKRCTFATAAALISTYFNFDRIYIKRYQKTQNQNINCDTKPSDVSPSP